MRFLVDECTGPGVARWLRDQGHDVFSVFDETRGSVDQVILQKAFEESRILITNDKDFGKLAVRSQQSHKGIILLRLSDELTANKIKVLQILLSRHAEELKNRFTVVTDNEIRLS